jgi:hypothetical protein
MVNQVINYDHWLADQNVLHLAGFVLAMDNMADSLPSTLRCRWECFSWTTLGLQIQEALERRQLPQKERFLAKHLLGFITNHLWRASEMTEVELNFDDVALIRAFYRMGRDSENKINRLVQPLESLLSESGLFDGKINHQRSLFKGMLRSVMHQKVFDPSIAGYPTMLAGVMNAKIAICLESAPMFEGKSAIRAVGQSLLPALKERNPHWRINDEDGVWWDVVLELPLSNLLAADDQAKEFEVFFTAALSDLREVGVVERLRERLSA